MYDLYTLSLVFMLLCPDVVVPSIPGSPIYSAFLHAIVFYVVVYYVSNFVPWWTIWGAAALVVMARLWMSSRPQ